MDKMLKGEEMATIIEKTMYKCPECLDAYDDYNRAAECSYNHAKETAINADFSTGYYTLEQVFSKYGVHKELTEEMKKITKDNCFVVSHLQCCDHPAYTIDHISKYGDITVIGEGSWSGYYSSKVGYHSLKDPRPKDELWKYSDSGTFGKNKKTTLNNMEAK